MRVYYPHAAYRYGKLDVRDYVVGVGEIWLAQWLGAQNLNFHLPAELVFKSALKVPAGLRYVRWIEWWGKSLGVPVVWENVVWLNEGVWDVKERMVWNHVPGGIKLCLDTGHAMLGSREPVREIRRLVRRFGRQITHLHIHENDLKRDLHLPPGKILRPGFLEELMRGRTWMYEPPGS